MSADMEAKMAIQNKTLPEQSEGHSGRQSALGRLFWIVDGNAALYFCVPFIVLIKADFAVYLIYILVPLGFIDVFWKCSGPFIHSTKTVEKSYRQNF